MTILKSQGGCAQTEFSPYEASFKEYLLARLWIPAERIRLFNSTGM